MYGPTEDKMDLVMTGSNSNYTVFNIKSPSLHFVVLPDLTPSSFVWYKVGSPVYGWSINYNFTVKPAAGPTYPLTWLAYGDMGISNSQDTADFTAKLIRSGEASFITHAGDISCEQQRGARRAIAAPARAALRARLTLAAARSRPSHVSALRR